MLKRVDVARVRLHQVGLEDGTFKAGDQVFDLKADGVGYSTTGGQVDDIKAKLDDYKAEDHRRQDQGSRRPRDLAR